MGLPATLPPYNYLPSTTRLVNLPPETLNILYASLLSRAVTANEDLPKGPTTRFHAKVPSPINLKDYLNRLTLYTPFTRDAILLSLVYLDRVSRLPPSNPSINPTPLLSDFLPPSARADAGNGGSTPHSPIPILNSYTVHRLLSATLIVASKFCCDGFIPQVRAAKVAGVSSKELIRLEVELLATLGWELGYELEELERVAVLLLRLGEKDGLVEPPATTEEDATPMASPSHHTREESTDTITQAPSTEQSSLTSSGASSVNVSPSSSPRAEAVTSPTPPSSPPSSDRTSLEEEDRNDETREDWMKRKGFESRTSSETVRRLERMSVAEESAGATIGVC